LDYALPCIVNHSDCDHRRGYMSPDNPDFDPGLPQRYEDDIARIKELVAEDEENASEPAPQPDSSTHEEGHSLDADGASGSGTISGTVTDAPQNPVDDCHRFANIVEEIGNNAANPDEFIQRMVDRFIGPNLNVQSGNDFERAANIGNREFGDSGFKSQFQDQSNQVRHFTGGLWAGYRYGPGVGQLGMNSNEDNTLTPGRGVVNSGGGILPTFWPTEDSKADVALNAVSIPLGANLTPRAAEMVDRGDRGGWRKIPANPGYKGLATAIRTQVCQ